MLEMSIYDRVIFKKGEQSKFILDCRSKLALTWKEMAEKLGVNDRSIRDWAKEETRISYVHAITLSKASKVSLPKEIKILKWTDHLKRAGIKGGTIQYAKNGSIGNEAKRKEAWFTWWEKEGKYKNSKIFQRKKINVPSKTIQLAEFVGILIGDGSIMGYTVKVTLDALVDKDYLPYVVSLSKQLFGIIPKIFNHRKFRATDVILQSRNVVDFCVSIGLKEGNKMKQNTDIPSWIKENEDFSIACIRGLVDTDGCFFRHSYIVNGKKYNYTKIAFTNRCPLVLESVRIILINLGFHVRITKDGNDVRIEDQKEVSRYIKLIGTSNPKFKSRIV